MREIVNINGVDRFKTNRIIRFLLDMSNRVDMNDIWKMHHNQLFTIEELKEFYQLIGYTVSGYEEVFEDK